MQINTISDIRILNSSRDSKKNRQHRETGLNPCPGPDIQWCHFCLSRLPTSIKKKKGGKRTGRKSCDFDTTIQHYRECSEVQSFIRSGWNQENMELIRYLFIFILPFKSNFLNYIYRYFLIFEIYSCTERIISFANFGIKPFLC